MSNIDKRALRERAESTIDILESIAGFEPSDIDGDTVELRFETEGGFDTGCDVSIVDQCQKAADVVRALLDELEAAKKRNVELSMLLEGADAIQTDYAEALECQDDNDSVLAAIVALKQRAESAEKHIAELRDWNVGLAQESFERQQRIAELQSVNDELKKFPDQIVNYVAKLGTSEIGGHTKNVIYRAAQKAKECAASTDKG